jgi:hypothetical protein
MSPFPAAAVLAGDLRCGDEIDPKRRYKQDVGEQHGSCRPTFEKYVTLRQDSMFFASPQHNLRDRGRTRISKKGGIIYHVMSGSRVKP